MKKLVLALVLVLAFSGCLLEPQVNIKSVDVSAEKAVVEIQSNKETSVEVKLLDESNNILCTKELLLKQGNNSVELNCTLSSSKVKVAVSAGGAVFSKELNVGFDGGSLNQKILLLAGQTLEGELMGILAKNFEKSSECTGQKYVDSMNSFFEKMSESNPSYISSTDNPFANLSQEEIVLLDEQINAVKSCEISVEKKITDEGSSKYSVNYSFVAVNCGDNTVSQQDVMIIEVNLTSNSAEVTKGSFSDSGMSEEEIAYLHEVYTMIGGCIKAMMLNISTLSSVSSSPEMKAIPVCTSGPGHIEIEYFGIEPSYAILRIKKSVEEEITVTGFTGSPVSISCNFCPQKLFTPEQNNGVTIFNVDGNFFEQGIGSTINEEITINYSLDGFNYSQLVTCTATVEDTWGSTEIQKENVTEIKNENATVIKVG
ncbi:MAG: hypothetical protein ABH986_01795 [archaeon]